MKRKHRQTLDELIEKSEAQKRALLPYGLRVDLAEADEMVRANPDSPETRALIERVLVGIVFYRMKRGIEAFTMLQDFPAPNSAA